MQPILHTSLESPNFSESGGAIARKTQEEVSTLQIAQIPDRFPSTPQNNTTDRLISIGGTMGLSIVAFLIFLWIVNKILCICKPNEILILSGLKRKTKDGHELGYRVTRYRTICIPILETVKRMDLTTMPVPVEVKNAYAKGGTPLNIQAIANVKISSNPEIVGNAIERFLDRDRQEIVRVARETLEGNLRGVVATLTPEELNEDRLRFAERITDDVQDDLQRLGLEIDTLKIQSVSDDVDYLSSIGRRQIAAIVRDAEIAESNALAEAEAVEAQTEQ
jgi:flotillin